MADFDALADEIESLMTNSEKREKMGYEGKKMAVSYSADSMVRKIDRLYRELAVSCCHFEE